MKAKLSFGIIAMFLLALPLFVNATFKVDEMQNDVMCNGAQTGGSNESLMDSYMAQQDPATTHNNDLWTVGNNTGQIGIGLTMHAVNSSIFPSASDDLYRTIVMEAYVIAKVYPSEGGTQEIFIHGIQGDEIDGTFDEAAVTWNNGPCGGSANFAAAGSHCNASWENHTLITSANAGKNVTWNVTKHTQIAIDQAWENVSFAYTTNTLGLVNLVGKDWANAARQAVCLNITYVVTNITSLSPEITFYNMTSEGGEGCTNWYANKENACETSDTTPTTFIRTKGKANCAIGVLDYNYTNLGSNRACSGLGSQEHTCTLIAQDALTQESSYIYIGCQTLSGLENRTSTSSGLKIALPSNNAESNGRDAIESGIQNALGSGYTLYTSQKVYARNSANSQSAGTFDKIVKWLNKVWAFNYLTGNQTAVGMFNISPVLYVWEGTNMTFGQINNTVYNLITATK